MDTAAAWGSAALPTEAGRDTAGILAAAAAGELAALVVAGVEVDDLPDPQAAVAALEVVPFLVSLEVRTSAVTSRADVVLPVSAVTEKAGTFLDWEGRPREFAQVFRDALALSDARVLAMLADELDVAFGRGDVASLRAELSVLGPWEGERAAAPSVPAEAPVERAAGEAVLATWRHLLDRGLLQEGDPYLAATARPTLARVSPATAASVGAVDGGELTVSTDSGSITLPLLVTAMPDGVVWLPAHSDGSSPRTALGAGDGDVVRIGGGAS